MDIDTGSATAAAARAARTVLTHLGQGNMVAEARMAKIARTAVFEEALLNALHARFAELRTVAK